MSVRNEPVLWIQLIGIGAIPLECILLALILGGAHLGPLVELQRLIISFIAIILPTISFLKRPADWGSLLIIKIPLVKRSIIQRQLSSTQNHLATQISLILGGLLLIFLFREIDKLAFVFNEISPFKNNLRITNVLLSIPLLSLMLWQWHQLSQSIWILTRSKVDIDKADYFSNKEIIKQRLSPGFECLPINELRFTPSISSPSIKKSEASKNQERSELNSKITKENILSSNSSDNHDKKTNTSGSKQ